MLKRKKALPVLIWLTAVFSFASVAYALPAYVPDRGNYGIRKIWAYSDFIWNEPGFTAWYPEAYEHEFRVGDEGFAQYDGYWGSNLPQAYLDLEDDQGQGWDEFVVGSDDAESIQVNTTYWIYIDLRDQDPSVTSAPFILEAERCRDWPGAEYNEPLEYYTIVSSDAPDEGIWGGGLSSSFKQNSQLQGSQKNNSQAPKTTTVFFKRPFTISETEQFVLKHQINPLGVNFRAKGGDFVGGFDCSKGVYHSLQDAIGKLKTDLSLAEKLAADEQSQSFCVLSKVRTVQQKMVSTLEREEIEISALVVENNQEVLSKLQQDPNVSLEVLRE